MSVCSQPLELYHKAASTELEGVYPKAQLVVMAPKMDILYVCLTTDKVDPGILL